MGKSQLPWGQTTLCVCVLVPVCTRVRACYKSHSSSPNDFLYCPLYKARNHLRVLRGSGGGVDWTHDNSASSCSLITATSESSADHTAPRTELHRPHVLCASEPPSIGFFFFFGPKLANVRSSQVSPGSLPLKRQAQLWPPSFRVSKERSCLHLA